MIFVIIGGASASGKTVLAKKLLEKLNDQRISSQLINMDNYFKEIPNNFTGTIQEYRENTNFDTPDMCDLDRLMADLGSLNKGQSFKQKIFEFQTNLYKKDSDDGYVTNTIHPSEIVIIEGIFAQYLANNYFPPEFTTINVNVANSWYPDIIETRQDRDSISRGISKEQTLINERKFVGAGYFSYTAKNAAGSDIYVLNDHKNAEFSIRKQLRTIGKGFLGVLALVTVFPALIIECVSTQGFWGTFFSPPHSMDGAIQSIIDEITLKQQQMIDGTLEPRKKPNALKLLHESKNEPGFVNKMKESESEVVPEWVCSIHTVKKEAASCKKDMPSIISAMQQKSQKIGPFFKPMPDESLDEQTQANQLAC